MSLPCVPQTAKFEREAGDRGGGGSGLFWDLLWKLQDLLCGHQGQQQRQGGVERRRERLLWRFRRRRRRARQSPAPGAEELAAEAGVQGTLISIHSYSYRNRVTS